MNSYDDVNYLVFCANNKLPTNRSNMYAEPCFEGLYEEHNYVLDPLMLSLKQAFETKSNESEEDQLEVDV